MKKPVRVTSFAELVQRAHSDRARHDATGQHVWIEETTPGSDRRRLVCKWCKAEKVDAVVIKP